jgi:hypothetical protein
VAALAAEGEVDVGGSWRERWEGGGGGRGIPTNRWWARRDWGRFPPVWELEDEREG